MTYLDARSQIKSGDLLAWSHRGWRTWYDWKIQLVRLATRSEYSHVGIAWVFGGRVFVVESVSPLARIVPLSNMLPCYWVPTGAQWGREAEEYALSLVGTAKYSQWEAVKALFGRNRADERWQCAELVLSVLARCRVFLNCRATPSEVVYAAVASGSAFRFLE